ncbi:hypothetical protein BSPWISOXPB_4975 [uncultured Gammaproteobacteria bacterium]|nr:hypothetical protein BSPWISOXPB_4975 [uncultured Gammaproteobacteria bacterium]
MTHHDTNNDLNLVIDNKSGVIKADNNITIHAKPSTTPPTIMTLSKMIAMATMAMMLMRRLLRATMSWTKHWY